MINLFHKVVFVIKMFFDFLHCNGQLRNVRKLDTPETIEERDAYISQVTKWWADRIFKFSKATVEVVGQENIPENGAVAFVSNHQSMLDIHILLSNCKKKLSFMGKMELTKVPIISEWMRYMQCTFIDRNDRRQSIEAMQEAVDKLKNGYSTVIFPEGTRSHGGPIAEFKKGSFKLAFRAEVPIVPVTIDGTWQMLGNKSRNAKCYLTIHPPIYIEGLTKEQKAELPEQIEAIVKSALPEEHFNPHPKKKKKKNK